MPGAGTAGAGAGAGGAVAGTGTGGAQQQQQPPSWRDAIFRMLLMYMLLNYFFKGRSSTPPQTDSTGNIIPSNIPLNNVWKEGQQFELRVYLSKYNSTSNIGEVLMEADSCVKVDYATMDSPALIMNSSSQNDFPSYLAWHELDLLYDYAESNWRQYNFTVKNMQYLLSNGSIYAHIFFTKKGYSHNPTHGDYYPLASIYSVYQLNRYLPQRKIVARKNLISGEFEITPTTTSSSSSDYAKKPSEQEKPTENETESAKELDPIVSFWKPGLTLHLVDDQTVYTRAAIPTQISQYMMFAPNNTGYYPVIYFDEFWIFREHLMPINDSLSELPLELSYSPISLFKWQMMSQMEQSFQMQKSIGTSAEGDADEFKRMIMETNPYLLGLTFLVTILHTVFDFLAFKNDISFWKNKKTFEGLSIRTMFLNAACQVIIFLYLCDNDTSWIILFSAGIGLLIEFWKIKRATIIKIDRSRWIPIVFEDRESYVKSKTKEYDEMAMKYLSWVLFPLIIGYAMYSLLYDTHKSWYSWVLGSLTGCVYTFGFIMMCPQLFINYKLKSVAHLPWKTFMYKALNTFIDDLFAFIIKMPILHRLSCFRDDIIFLIYLYQRWIYPVDKSRVNEFGQGGEDDNPSSTPSNATNVTETTPTVTSTNIDANANANADADANVTSPKSKSGTKKKKH